MDIKGKLGKARKRGGLAKMVRKGQSAISG